MQVISKKDQAQYWHSTELPYSYFSVDMFAGKFKESSLGKKLDEDLSVPYDKSHSHKNALSFTQYSLSKWELFRACMSRELLLMKRNSFVYVFKTSQVILLTSASFHSSPSLLPFSSDGTMFCVIPVNVIALNMMYKALKFFKHVKIFLSAAYRCCNNHNDCIFEESDAYWCPSWELLHGSPFLCSCYTSCWWDSRDVYDCCKTWSFLQAERVAFLSSMGLCNSSQYSKDSSFIPGISCLDVSHLLCHWIQSWSLEVSLAR